MFHSAHHFTINGGNFTVIKPEESNEINKWLNAPDCSANYVTAEDKKLQGTGKWIFDLDEYKKWKSEPGVLWIQGPAGSGKTVLTTTILQDIKEAHKNAVWYHYFDTRDNTGLKTTYRGFLLSLIKQLGLGNKKVNPALYALYESNKFTEITTEELQKLLGTMIKERNTGYIVVDAMDECKEAGKVLRWLSSHSSQLWMLVTSRLPAVGFENGIINIALGEKGSRMNADIELYLKSTIDTIPRFRDTTRDYIKESLKNGAHGVFRWVECQLRAVQQCTSHTSVKKALDKLPKDLEETYEQALKRCKDQGNAEEAQHLLLWLLYAYEPLTKRQFGEILAVDLEEQVIYPSMELQVEWAVDSTFVTVGQDNIVQLAHASVKEYLISYSLQKETQDLFQLNEKLAHDIMTQTTIIYLMQKENIDSGYYESFAYYSVEKWLSHASKVEEYKLKGKAQNLIHRMLENNNQYFARWETKYRRQRYFSPKTPLYYGALNGLCEVVPKLISELDLVTAKENIDISGGGGEYGNALQAASSKGHEAAVKLLLETGADANAHKGYYRDALRIASSQGNEVIVKLLLENGADVNAYGEHYGNALQVAAYRGNEAIVRLLLENGADVNVQGGQYRNALLAATSRGNEAIVKLLLENGADVNVQGGQYIVKLLLYGPEVNLHGGQYRNALLAAANRGNEAIVKLLLENGADVNVQGGQYGNALQAAAYRENEAIVKLLLENGADVNLQGGYFENALQAAAYRKNEAIVKLLLENGADVNAQGGQYGNALQAAAYRANEAIVKLLLENGADVNLQGGYFENALQAASSQGNEVIVKLLLENGAEYGNALQAAAYGKNEAIVKLLLENGADVNAQGGEYSNALQAAAHARDEAIVKLLLEKGADVNAQGGEYGNALQAAAYQENEAIVKLLLEKGADVNAQGGEYSNALQAAAHAKDEAIVKLLLKKGADVNAQGGEYGNALQAAAYQENEAIVKLLLEKGADVNAQGGEYGNALQAAAYQENEAIAAAYQENEVIVKLLLEKGADVNAQGGKYGNALQAAAYQENEAIVKLLLEMGADVNTQGGK
ncbi:ankyrin repeat-containing domain protein [Lentinula edodes]|nr:ankyrin repeat-containing domain protein [Lentinula edodes]